MGDFTLATPVARNSEGKYVVEILHIVRSPAGATIEVIVQDSAGSEDIRRTAFTVPNPAFPSATLSGLIGALLNPRASETGSNARRANFRVLGYLFDNGYFPSGTLNP